MMKVKINDPWSYLNDIQKARLKRMIRNNSYYHKLKDLIFEYLVEIYTPCMPISIDLKDNELNITLRKLNSKKRVKSEQKIIISK